MPVSLPYRFDTSPVVKLILRGVIGLLLVIASGLLYSLFGSRDLAAVVLLAVVGLIVIYFGTRILGHLEGASGTITRDEIVVQPEVLFGIRLRGPMGRFRVGDFKVVRVERVSAPAVEQGGPHERVSLLGREGTPDILVARTSNGAGRVVGRDLAAALGLQYEEQSAPY